jgi:hypothetical protein
MRRIVRIVLVVVCVALSSAATLRADHFVANCPLALVGSTNPSTQFHLSPHGVFRNGSSIYVLRGQTITTLAITDSGEVQVVREDLLPGLFARDTDGAVAYSGGYLFISGEGGLEIFDLRNTRAGAGATAPLLVSRTPGLEYKRLAVLGNVIAGLNPASDLPCTPGYDPGCANQIDIISISNLATPRIVSSIGTLNTFFVAFEDIAFANGFLYATGLGGTYAFNLDNPASPSTSLTNPTVGRFLVTNGRNLLGVGQDTLIGVFTIGPNANLNHFNVFTLPAIPDREMTYRFSREAYIDDLRLITLIDEVNPNNRRTARTIAFDVFDFSVPAWEGRSDRIYENLTFTFPDEIKYDPLAVGPFVYVTGEMSGAQAWGSCGQLTGRIELDGGVATLPCGGAEIRGWVTGVNRVTSVEVFLGNTPLGFAQLGRERTDVASRTPVSGWRISVNLDAQARGQQTLRVVATDVAGNRRQIASQPILFSGPGQNCSVRRRSGKGN